MTPFFFNPERGWNPDPEGAELLLQQVPGQNIFHRLEAGSWQSVDPSSLSGVESGLLWKYRQEEDRVFFDGLLEVDDRVRDLLAGLGPQMRAGKAFSLGSEEAETFIDRVRTAGGSLRQVSGLSPLLQRVSVLIKQDVEDLREIEAGDHSRIPAFRERGPLYPSLLGQASKADEPLAPFQEAVRSRAAAEQQLQRIILRTRGEQTPVRPQTRTLVLRDLDWTLSADGIPCRWQDDELIIDLPGGQVVFGQHPRVVTG